MKNEAVRIFLAGSALLLTMLLTNPMSFQVNQFENNSDKKIMAEQAVEKPKAVAKKSEKLQPLKSAKKSVRNFAFYFRR